MQPNPRKRLANVLRQYSDPELLADVALVVAHTFGINEPPQGVPESEQISGFNEAIRNRDPEAILSFFPERMPNDDIVNWFARELRKKTPLKPLGPEDDWSKDQGRRLLRRHSRRELLEQMQQKGSAILQWYELVRPKPQLLQLGWDEVVRRVDDELESLAPSAETAAGTVVMEWDDGWTMQELPVECLDAEGRVMQHCVGRGGYDEAVQSGATRIFSLRDPQGKPHVTIEYSTSERRFFQVRGKQNKQPIPEYLARVKQFMLLNLDLFAPFERSAKHPYLESLRLVQDGLLAEDHEALASYGQKMTANPLRGREGMRSGAVESRMTDTATLHLVDILRVADLQIGPGLAREHRRVGRPTRETPLTWRVYSAGRYLGDIGHQTYRAVQLRGVPFEKVR